MIIKQLTVFVENRMGYLSEVTSLLAGNGVDLKALSLADTKDFGILRLITDDAERALEILRAHGILGKITEVVGAKIPHRPGGLNEALAVLAEKSVNVEYVYAFLSGSENGANMVLKASDNAAADAALSGAGFKPID